MMNNVPRQTKIVTKLNLQKPIKKPEHETFQEEPKKSNSILSRNKSNTSICSRTSKCEKRSTKISFTAMNEVQEYEKQSAIDEDEKLKMSRNNSKIGLIENKRSNSKFKQLANRVSQTIAGERPENNVIPMKS